MSWFHHPRWFRRRHPHIRVILRVGNFAVELIPEEVIHMAATMKAGQTLPMSIEYLDQNGQPMATMPALDSTPSWANTASSSVDTLTAAPDGKTASLLGNGSGSDTVQLKLSVNGVPYSATGDVTVTSVAPQQTLTSIGIVFGTPTP